MPISEKATKQLQFGIGSRDLANEIVDAINSANAIADDATTATEVDAKITAATADFVTATDVDTAISTATADFVTATDVDTAISTALSGVDASTLAYTPDNLANWSGVAPTSLADALNRLAAALGPIA